MIRQYAILDECTSAVTLEIEKVMYDHATGGYNPPPMVIHTAMRLTV